ncbi:MAG: glycosyltransferase [Acidimicrobiales bacterium]
MSEAPYSVSDAPMVSSGRVLIISRTIPGADSSAGERRLAALAAMLAERAPVDLVSTGSLRPSDESARLRALRVNGTVRVPYGAKPVRLTGVLTGTRYALIVAESWQVCEQAAPLVRRFQPQAVFAVDTVDLHFVRDAREDQIKGSADPNRDRARMRELSTYVAADVRVFTSEVERELYEKLPLSRCDHNLIIPIIVEQAPLERHPRKGEVVFVGGLWHRPNLDGIIWFCAEVWPRIQARVPHARLRVIGSNAWSVPVDASELTGRPGVTLEGFVADLGPVYAGSSVAVAPLRFGAGVKGKVCEAMAAGVPVVTTSIGAEGIRALRDRDLLVADDEAAFAQAVVSLLEDSDLAAKVGASGAVAIQSQCGRDVVRPEVQKLLLLDSPPARPPTRSSELSLRAAGTGWRLGRRLQTLCQHGLT